MISSKKERYCRYLFGIVSLLIIRYCYIYLIITLLEPAWYSGTGGYGISFNTEKEVLSSLTYIIFLVVFARIYGLKSLSFCQTIALLIMVLYIMPLSCSFALNDLGYDYYFATTIYSALVLYGLYRASEEQADSANGASHLLLLNSKMAKTINSICVFLCILLIAYKVSYNGFDLNLSLDGEDVYSNRADYAEYRADISGTPFAYLLVIILNITSYIAPIYCYLSMKHNNYFGAMLALLAVLSTFSLSSGKSEIFFLAVLALVLIADRLNYRLDNPSIIITIVLLLLFIISIIDSIFIQSNAFFMTILRRTMYIPVWMGSMYYDFFTSHIPLFFSDSAIGLQMVIPSVYEEGVLDLISEAYFRGIVPSPNTGLFAEAIMQLGYLGVFIFPVILVVTMKRCGAIYSEFGRGVALIVAVKASVQLLNVPLLRTDFVLSFILLAFLLWLLMHGSRNANRGVSSICSSGEVKR